ncbi:MAG TPA: cytochrome C oxidase subunit IV family protein [Chlamydiales bacterium]|nr:cytochrome C oxidase subunit IV family protein [Chlamydiales bacterium]
MSNSLAARIVGYISSLILTLIAFLIIVYPDFFHVGTDTNILFLIALAMLQFIFQSICFLHVMGEKGPRWNLVVYVSTLSIVLIIVVFSIWVMNHLNYRMMM